MLTDAVALSTNGGIFESETKFKLFGKPDEKDYRVVVLFGRNGTGKSSIAKAFRQIRGEVFPVIQSATLLDKDEKIVNLSNEEKERIFIFDEDFVYNNVKLQEDHLETIVMLGEAANLTSQISAAETKKNEAEQNCIQMKKIYDEFLDKDNIKSPDFYLKKIETKLKGDKNWAGRQRLITGAKVNAQVNNQTYLQFAKCIPSQDEVKLYKAFEEKLAELEEAKSGTKVINQRVPEFSVLKTYPEQEIIDLLARQIDEPVITEREKRLLDLIRQGKAQDLNDRLRFFQAPDNTICPYCFQTLENQYKQTMVKSLEKVLNDVVKEHQDLLGKYIIKNTCDIDLSEFQILKDYSKCSELVNQINAEILKINSLINTKIQNPYEPVILQSKLVELVSLLSSSLKSLEEQRQDFNSQALQTAPLLNELKRINDELAALEIEDLVLQLHKQQEELSKAKNDLLQSENNYINAKNKVIELEAKRKNVHIAIDTINAYLAYIFSPKID